jgi:hypothetical protein
MQGSRKREGKDRGAGRVSTCPASDRGEKKTNRAAGEWGRARELPFILNGRINRMEGEEGGDMGDLERKSSGK